MSSKEMIEGLLSNKNWAYESLYRENFNSVKNYVLRNSGTIDDAKDIFQDTSMALIKMLSKDGFELYENTKLSTLTYSIAKRLWLMSLRKRKLNISSTDISDLNYDFDKNQELMLEETEYEEKHQVIAKCIKSLGEECQKLLDLYYFKNLKLKNIATILSYTEGFVRVKKNRCMNTLKSKIKETSIWQNQN